MAPQKPVQVDLTTENNEPIRGKITIERNINVEHAQLSGLALQPLCRVEGDLSTVDLSKMKTKLKSGEHSSGSLAVLCEVYWPHHGLPPSRIHGQIPPYNQLSPVQFFCGLINTILIHTPDLYCPGCPVPRRVINQMKNHQFLDNTQSENNEINT